MINKLKQLGEVVYKNEGNTNPFRLNITLKKANVVILDFLIDGETVSFSGIDTMEFDQTKKEKILYLNSPARSISPFPTYNIFIDSNEAKCKNNIRKSFVKLIGTLVENAQISKQLMGITDYLENKENQIPLIDGIYLNLSIKKSNLVTLRINNEFIGESQFYKTIIEHYKNSSDQNNYTKYGTTSIGNNNQCYTCGNIMDKLYGFCDTFKFYSANEQAYIAGGFQQINSWKNYPVCPTCTNYLQIGKERLNLALDRYFYGNKYFIIPTPTLRVDGFYVLLKDIEQDFHQLSLSREKENNQQIQSEMEDDIFETLAKQKDQATFTFFFYKESNSEFKILQEAEDILPSRFKNIIEAKKKSEDYLEFKDLKGLYKKGEYHNLSFNFGVIRTFFPSNFNNDFLDITTKILKGQKMSRSFILHQIVEYLAEGFRNEKLYHNIEKAEIFLKFLFELNLIEQTKCKLEVIMQNKYEDYFVKHPDFYNADWKKAVFLTGVLAQNVMDIQYKERKATPFRSRLSGLKLDHRTIKRLLPESIEKLEQYKQNYYRDLEEVISTLMVSGEPELIVQSVDEISFYFAMGMNLNKQFKLIKETKGENNE